MPLTIHTLLLRWLGVTAILIAVPVSIVVTGGWIAVALTWFMFGGMGAALLFMSATILGTPEGITVKHLHGRSSITWDEVKAASTGGGNFVLYAASRRVTMPGPEFWRGSDRKALSALIDESLNTRGIVVQKSARAALHYSRKAS